MVVVCLEIHFNVFVHSYSVLTLSVSTLCVPNATHQFFIFIAVLFYSQSRRSTVPDLDDVENRIKQVEAEMQTRLDQVNRLLVPVRSLLGSSGPSNEHDERAVMARKEREISERKAREAAEAAKRQEAEAAAEEKKKQEEAEAAEKKRQEEAEAAMKKKQEEAEAAMKKKQEEEVEAAEKREAEAAAKARETEVKKAVVGVVANPRPVAHQLKQQMVRAIFSSSFLVKFNDLPSTPNGSLRIF